MNDAIRLSNVERMELERRASSRTGRAEDARRARLILLRAEGHTWDEACERVPCSRGFVASWTKRFEEQRLAGLYSRHLGQVTTVLTAQLEARILEATRRGPRDGTTHWSTRRLGEQLSGRRYGLKTGLNDTIRKITSAGVVTTFAGTFGTVGSTCLSPTCSG
jgi:transposase